LEIRLPHDREATEERQIQPAKRRSGDLAARAAEIRDSAGRTGSYRRRIRERCGIEILEHIVRTGIESLAGYFEREAPEAGRGCAAACHRQRLAVLRREDPVQRPSTRQPRCGAALKELAIRSKLELIDSRRMHDAPDINGAERVVGV